MLNPMTFLKSNLKNILCIVLATLLTVSYVTGKSDRTALDMANKKLTEHVQLNERLSSQNRDMAQELKDKPVAYIEVVKEVQTEICNGKIKQAAIEALPSKKKEVGNVQTTVDIDDRLPDDLIRLLN